MSGQLRGFPEALARRAVTHPDELAGLHLRLAAARRVVVIVGTSISGLVLAARLGRAASTGEGLEVVLVTGPPPLPRRLIAGCSLRRSTIRRLAAALDVAEDPLREHLGGPAASFRRLAVARADSEPGPLRLVRRRGTDAASRPYVGLSTRHGAILDALRRSLDPDLAVNVVAADVPRHQALRAGVLPLATDAGPAALALPPERTVVLNTTSQADLLRPGGRPLPEPRRYVCAVQVPLVPRRAPPGCGADVGFAPMTPGPPAPHLAFFTPFRDPDTPVATWYGIDTMVVPAAVVAEQGHEALLDGMWRRLGELADHLGFAEVDPADTRGGAVVAVVHDTGTRTEALLGDAGPVVDAHRAFTSGAPAINVDGMLAAVVGADAFAGAFLASDGPPVAAARAALGASDRALRPVRWRNRATEYTFFRAPEGVRAGLARAPRWAWTAFVADWSGLRGRVRRGRPGTAPRTGVAGGPGPAVRPGQ